MSASPRRRPVSAALERLGAVEPGAPWRSLAPDRDRARSLRALGEALLTDEIAPELAEALADGLVAIQRAMRTAFPDNIFGDLDFLAASLLRQARAAGSAAWLRQVCAEVVELQARFGRGTSIRFRYVHDFLYGFDWAKWIARDPVARDQHGPFSPAFLDSMARRGQELLDLIAAGRDRKYPPLPDGRPRNPFGFSREPAAEIALHRRLARAGLVPVEAWRLDARPRWDRPYQALRREHAGALGLRDAAGAVADDGA